MKNCFEVTKSKFQRQQVRRDILMPISTMCASFNKVQNITLLCVSFFLQSNMKQLTKNTDAKVMFAATKKGIVMQGYRLVKRRTL